MCAQATIARTKGAAFGATGRATGFHQHRTQPAITATGLAAAALASALMIAGAQAGPARKMRGAGEAAHIGTDFGHHDLSGSPLNARDRDQTFNRRGERGQQLLDPLVEFPVGFLDIVDIGQQAAYHEAMMRPEATG